MSNQEILEKMKNERLGEENYNNFGTLMKIVEYNKTSDVWVEFQDEYKEKVHTDYRWFKKGNVKNPYDKEVCGVGYIGVGKYKVSENGKHTKAYEIWKAMLKRCYNSYCLNKQPTYTDCYVCELWHCYQNFAKWYEKEIYECKDEKMCLDKDILIKGNKIYSPETCVFVPNRINVLFTKSNKIRGEYPIGVNYCKRGNKLQVNCNIYENGKKKQKHLGYFPLNKPFQAFTCYKEFKENYIKQVADEYKNLIPNKLYEAMYKYQVEIND